MSDKPVAGQGQVKWAS